MMAMVRSALVVLGLAACAPVPQPRSPPAAVADRHGERCAFDHECPNGSCRNGTCSWVAPDAESERAALDASCSGRGAERICAPWAREFFPRRQ